MAAYVVNLALYLVVVLLPFVRLSIPAMGIDVEVIAVTGNWAHADYSSDAWTLADIGDQVGWLDPAYGPEQGGPGNIVLAGHYTIPPDGSPGAFHDLSKLAYGDFIYALRPDGVTIGYRVIQSSIVDDDDLTVLWDYGDQRLTLIGCPGTDYAHRLVMVAEELGAVVCVEPDRGVVPCLD